MLTWWLLFRIARGVGEKGDIMYFSEGWMEENPIETHHEIVTLGLCWKCVQQKHNGPDVLC